MNARFGCLLIADKQLEPDSPRYLSSKKTLSLIHDPVHDPQQEIDMTAVLYCGTNC